MNVLRLLEALADNLRLVVLNACHSEALAADIPPRVKLAIGMSNAISDTSAIAFAQSFYEALAFGKSVQVAVKVARASVDEEDFDLVRLFPAEDPEGLRDQPLLGQ